MLFRSDIALAYAGVDGAVVHALADAGAKGIVSSGLGSGSAPRAFLNALVEARKRGVCIVAASQTGNGRVMARRALVERGFVVADNLAPKKARILLMLALTKTGGAEAIQRMMLRY